MIFNDLQRKTLQIPTPNVKDAPMATPRTGEKFKTGAKLRCEECGMEVEVKKPCNCEDHEPSFECCGKPMVAATR